VHLGTAAARRLILADLKSRGANWLVTAALAMRASTEQDWREWANR
jgi:hypothetical protein